MDKQEVVNLMKSSKSENEWDANCDKVKAACDGYPDFWYSNIVMSGLFNDVSSKWGGTDQIQIYYSG